MKKSLKMSKCQNLSYKEDSSITYTKSEAYCDLISTQDKPLLKVCFKNKQQQFTEKPFGKYHQITKNKTGSLLEGTYYQYYVWMIKQREIKRV